MSPSRAIIMFATTLAVVVIATINMNQNTEIQILKNRITTLEEAK